MRRLIIGMTGSTGAIFGVRFLEALKHADVESHLIISKWAQRTTEHGITTMPSVLNEPDESEAPMSPWLCTTLASPRTCSTV